MMKQFKKALSILCILALLVSGIAMAFADEAVEAPAEENISAAEEAPVQEAPAPQPVEEPAPQPAPQPEPEPVKEEPAPQPEPQPEPEPVKEEPAPQPEPQPEPEPAKEEPAPQPEPQSEPEPAKEEPAPQPEPEQEAPASQPEAQPEAQSEAQPEAQPVAQPEAQPEQAPAQEEAQQPEEGEASYIIEETPGTEPEEGEDALVEIDDGWGYVDPEVINENTPEITDEFKGIRTAELHVGDSLTDSLVFGEELDVTLRGSSYPTVILKLYISSGSSLNVKIDGKAVGFTPADSDDPSMNLYTFELTNTASQKHEIVLTTNDNASFRLAAEPKQTEVQNDTPETEENTPAEEQPAETPADEKPENTGVITPAPETTVELSVKTYDALKVGGRISDTLVSGQKARIQVKCGKNPYVTLTLNASPDEAIILIDGSDAQFTRTAEGTYTCELEEVAFRKFNISITAKQELSFSLSASASKEAAEDADTEETEEAETAEESSEEPAEETEEVNPEETTEETTEENPEEATEETTEENPEEATEETTEENPEESAEEASEESETADMENEGNEEEAVEEPIFETRETTIEVPTIATVDERPVEFGTECLVTADLSGYDNTPEAYHWYYSEDGGKNWIPLETEDQDVYHYILGDSNWYFRFKLEVTFVEVVEVTPVSTEDSSETESDQMNEETVDSDTEQVEEIAPAESMDE